jgi:hypothetical protein
VFVIGASLYGVFFLFNFLFISIGQSFALSVSVCSGVGFQPAHCIATLMNFTAESIQICISIA